MTSWAEVSLLLRKPIVSEQDMLYTVAAAEAGLMYIDQVYNNNNLWHFNRIFLTIMFIIR